MGRDRCRNSYLGFFLAILMLGLFIQGCGNDSSSGTNLKERVAAAAQSAYDKLNKVWLNQKDEDNAMWYQGNALDTMIDYIAITNDKNRGLELGGEIDKHWSEYVKYGFWFDDFGWWGGAMLNAARHHELLGKDNADDYQQKAYDMLEHMHEASQVWELYRNHQCPPYLAGSPCDTELWLAYAPRFEGGVWNSLYGTEYNCLTDFAPSTVKRYPEEDPSGYEKNPKQNTVTNGLYLILAARYYRQFGDESVFEIAKKSWSWFDNWLSLPDVAVDQCLGMINPTCNALEDANLVKPSLLDSQTNLVRERVCTYAMYNGCYAIEPVYKCGWLNLDAMIWTGDQGLVFGAMVDLMQMAGVTNPPDTDDVKQILAGSLDYLTLKLDGCPYDTLAEGVLRPWIYFNGWQKGCDGEGFQLDNTGENYKTGPGVFMRQLLYAYQNNEDLRKYIELNYRTFILKNAQVVMDGDYDCACCYNPIDTGPPYDVCNLSCQTNRLATLIMALAIL